MFNETSIDRRDRSQWELRHIGVAIAIGVLFVLAGLEGMTYLVPFGRRHGLVATCLVFVAAPVILITVTVGLGRALTLLRGLLAHIRWWHMLWLLLFASALVFRVRGANQIEQNPVDAWALYRIGLEIIVAAVLFIRLALRKTPWFGSMFRGFVGVLTVLGLVDLASTAWSVFPSWTFYKSCEYLLDVAVLAAILATVGSLRSYRNFFNWTWTLYGALLATTWLGVVLWPKEALYAAGFKVGLLGARLNGVIPAVSANDIGTFAAILGLIALSRLLPVAGERRDRAWYVLVLAASGVTMVFSQTRSAFAGFALGFFLLLVFSRRLRLSAVLSFVVAPLLIATSVGGLVWSFLERGQDTRQLESLSSRVQWWSFAWQKFLERPLLGYGAYAGGRFAVMQNLGLTQTSTMHSDYLELIVGTGIWGVIPFLIALIGAWWVLARYIRHSPSDGPDKQLAYEAIGVLGLLSLRSVFMTMLVWHPPLDYFVIVGYAEYLRRRRLRPSAAQSHIIREVEPELAGVS